MCIVLLFIKAAISNFAVENHARKPSKRSVSIRSILLALSICIIFQKQLKFSASTVYAPTRSNSVTINLVSTK